RSAKENTIIEVFLMDSCVRQLFVQFQDVFTGGIIYPPGFARSKLVDGSTSRDSGNPTAQTSSPLLIRGCFSPHLQENFLDHVLSFLSLAEYSPGKIQHQLAVAVVKTVKSGLIPLRHLADQILVRHGNCGVRAAHSYGGFEFKGIYTISTTMQMERHLPRNAEAADGLGVGSHGECLSRLFRPTQDVAT